MVNLSSFSLNMYSLIDEYPDINVEWGPAYFLSFCNTLESKVMEFQ